MNKYFRATKKAEGNPNLDNLRQAYLERVRDAQLRKDAREGLAMLAFLLWLAGLGCAAIRMISWLTG